MPKMIYVVTENTPGYLPESEPTVLHSREEAVEYIKDQVEQILDDESQYPEGEQRKVVDGSPEELYVKFERPSDPHDLGWVIEATEEEDL